MAYASLKSLGKFALLVGLLIGSGRLDAAPSATQPTMNDVQAAIDAHQYSAAVKMTGKLLGGHSAGVSRFQVAMLKGDALVGMKAISTAVAAYKSAERETKDPHEMSIARWSVELLQTAGSSIYTPKMIAIGVPARGPFDLTKPDDKKAAFGALLDDDLSTLEPKIKIASTSQSMPEIWPVLQQVEDLGELDNIANGSDDKTSAISTGLLDHSRNLLNNVLKEYWARLGDIDTHANTTTLTQTQQSLGNTIVNQTITRKNGLTDSNKSELNDMITTSRKIHEAGQNLIKLAKNQQEWATVLSDSNRVAARANDVLTADYGTPINQTSQTTDNGYYNGNNGTGIYGNGIGANVYTPVTAGTPPPTSQPTRPTPPPTKKKTPTTPTAPKTNNGN